MKRIVKRMICIVVVAVMMSFLSLPASATVRRSGAGENTGVLKPDTVTRPLPGGTSSETTAPTQEEQSYKELAPVVKPLPGVTVKPTETTEPSSGDTPIKSDDAATKPVRPLPGESDLIPVTLTQTNAPDRTVKPAETKATEPAAANAEQSADSNSPYFTKHPTGETIKEGANAQFVAIAENADGYSWIILSADGKETYTVKEACSHFKGLKAEGSITTRLTLYYIPASLNGYYVACIAEGNDEKVTSNGAMLNVQSKNPTMQVKETVASVAETTTETAAESVPETTSETALTETVQAEAIETMEETIPTAVLQEEENAENAPVGKYMIGGICIVLLAAAFVLLVILLKTIRKGKGR